MTVAGKGETIGNQVVLQYGIPCFYCKGLGHFVKECRSAKRVKDYEYHKEKMFLCKKDAKGIQLSAEQSEWLQDTDDEPDEQELEAHYMYMANIREVLHDTDENSGPTYDSEPLEKVHPDNDYNVFATERHHSEQPESINNTYVMEEVDSNVNPESSNMSTNERGVDQNAEEPKNEHVLLASLITNLKLDVDENKSIQKQLKKANTSLTQKLEKNKRALRDCQFKLERYKTFQTNQQDKDKVELECKEALDDIKQLFQKLLIPIAHKALKNVGIFEQALKEEMLEEEKYVKFVEKDVDDLKLEIDDLKSQLETEKTDFPKVDDLLLQELFSRDFVCVILLSPDDIDEYSEMACNHLEKIEE
ncbi:retrovirus-related pol polyprotein from transposon TNT 1-94 [Tanacetum coccineum]